MSLRRLVGHCALLWHVLLVEQAFNVPDHCPHSTTASQCKRNGSDKVFTIGGLFSIHQQDVDPSTGQIECTSNNPLSKPRFHRFAVEQAEALILAVETINSRSDVLPNATLHYAMWDTCGYLRSHCVENQAQALVDNNDVISTILGPLYYQGPEPYSEHDIVNVYKHTAIHKPGSSTGRAVIPFVDIPYINNNNSVYSDKDDVLVYPQQSCVLQAQAAVDLLEHVGWQQVSLVTSGDNCGREVRQEFANYMMKRSLDCQPNVTHYEISEKKMSQSISGSGHVNDPIQSQELEFLDINSVTQRAPQAVVLLSSMFHANRFIQSFLHPAVSSTHSFYFLLGEFWGIMDNPDELFQTIIDLTQKAKSVVSIRSQINGVDKFQDHMTSLRWNSKNLDNAFLQEYWEERFNCSIQQKTCNDNDFLEPITRPIVRHLVAPLVIDSVYMIAAYLDNFMKTNPGQSAYYSNNNNTNIQKGSDHPVTNITSWTGNMISLSRPSVSPTGFLQPSRWVYEFLLLNSTDHATADQHLLLGKWEFHNGNQTVEFNDTILSRNSDTFVTCRTPQTIDPTEMLSLTLPQEINLEAQQTQAQGLTSTNSSNGSCHTKAIGLVAVPLVIAVLHILFGIFFMALKGWSSARHSVLSLGGMLLIIDSTVVIIIAIPIASNALPSLECDNLTVDFLINTSSCVCYAALLVKLLSQSILKQFTARLALYMFILSTQCIFSGLAFFRFNTAHTLYQTNADHCLEARQHVMVVVAYWYNVVINIFSIVTLLITCCGEHQPLFNSKPQVVVAMAATCSLFHAVAVSILLWSPDCLIHSAFLVITAVYPAITTLAISGTTTLSSFMKKRNLDENGIPTSISVSPDLHLHRIQSHHYISDLLHNPGFLALQSFLEEDVIKEMNDVVIEPRRLAVGKEIGKGNFGEVLRGELDGSIPVAVKSIQGRLNQFEVNSFIREGLQMKHLNHPNVMELIGICWSDDPTNERHVSPFIVLPYMELGDLKNYLRKQGPKRLSQTQDNAEQEPIPLMQLVKFGHQIARGMEYISGKGIIHRDLAARNCMVNWNHEIKVADFGLARTTAEGKDYYRMGQTGELPIRWMALESLVYMTFDAKTDVWSYGVTLWEVLTLAQVPYPGRQNRDVIALLRSGQRLEKPENCPQEIYDIMHQCWNVYPESRPSFSSIVQFIEEFLLESMNYFDLAECEQAETPTDSQVAQQPTEREREDESVAPVDVCTCACDVGPDSKDTVSEGVSEPVTDDESESKDDLEHETEIQLSTEVSNNAADDCTEETTSW